jgi:hypothetical protein
MSIFKIKRTTKKKSTILFGILKFRVLYMYIPCVESLTQTYQVFNPISSVPKFNNSSFMRERSGQHGTNGHPVWPLIRSS